MNYQHHKEFEEIISQLLELMGYSIELRTRLDKGVDIIANRKNVKKYIEIKFYRSAHIPASVITESANRLAYNLKQQNGNSGTLIVNSLVGIALKNKIIDDYGISIWDRNTLYSFLTTLSSDLRDQFEKLLLEAQQGTNTNYVFGGFESEKLNEESEDKNTQVNFKTIPVNKGAHLYKELQKIQCGKNDWNAYEKKCKEILEFLFENDLSLWDKQTRTDDGLSRFDLICRIASSDDYWKALINAFNTRFILFEFKNYCAKISQDQIYTTERYLFNKALRSVGFIISRLGGTDGAIQAAKGSLKEHGKLIMILSDENLCEMLKLKDNGDSPNDYLSNLLDKWLISLSR
ncbi:restriction endonuclease [Flavobacterium dankookense]|uniref:Restriction endonuclease n=1 Tax=Flavobacterium dankookense TaxID=706186 RepID=A0A4V3CS66_9FLAO|nr:restriction endonuclease [Flavobacterium dankookense]TDP59462.1 restriction endonuclease [Flavobacterium dankookense]